MRVTASTTRDEIVRLRAHPAHKAAWLAAAAKEGRTLSGWLRWLADRRLGELSAKSTRGAEGSDR